MTVESAEIIKQMIKKIAAVKCSEPDKRGNIGTFQSTMMTLFANKDHEHIWIEERATGRNIWSNSPNTIFTDATFVHYPEILENLRCIYIEMLGISPEHIERCAASMMQGFLVPRQKALEEAKAMIVFNRFMMKNA